MANRVEVEVDEVAIAVSDVDLGIVRDAIDTILKREGFSADRSAQVTALLTSDARLRRLNREFAGEDQVTDVLSFGTEADDNFPDPADKDDVVLLGDIAISLPQTRRQAEDKGVPFERELAMLAIHGTLHLLGYDHAEPSEERVMFGKTDNALVEILSSRP